MGTSISGENVASVFTVGDTGQVRTCYITKGRGGSGQGGRCSGVD
jgi:hypothetical protein